MKYLNTLPLILSIMLLVVASFIPIHASAKDPEFLCIPDQAVGFDRKADGAWAPISVTPPIASKLKYLLRKIKKDENTDGSNNFTYAVYLMGQTDIKYYCSEVTNSHAYICPDGLGQFKFSTKTGRFLVTVTTSYWSEDTSYSGEPYLAIGTCSQL